MSKEKYSRSNGQWQAYSERSTADMAADIYEQVGERFHIVWEDEAPVIDFNNLPEGVTESEVRQAVKDNVPSN